VAGRKANSLLQAGARVTLVAPEMSGDAQKLVDAGAVGGALKPFEPSDLEGVSICIAATDQSAVNRAVYNAATERHIPVNVVDAPELCSFIVPSKVTRGDLTIAISTGGKSPAVAKRVRRELQADFGDEWRIYLDMMGAIREGVLSRITDEKERRVIFDALADSELFDLVASGKRNDANRLVQGLTGLDALVETVSWEGGA